MEIRNIQNKLKFLLFILLLVFLTYIINHTIIAYKYIYNDSKVINQLDINTSYTENSIIFNSAKDFKWLHHMNNVEVVNTFQDKSNFFELDVIIQNDDIYVAHDSLELNNSITLKDYLSIFTSLDNRMFWFDVKNIDISNYSIFLSKLNAILSHTNNGLVNKSNIIIEIGNLDVLKLVYGTIKNEKIRYKLSWYFPYVDLTDRNKAISSINNYLRHIDDYSFDYVSSDLMYYNILNKIFPNRKKLFWYTGGCVIERKYKRALLYYYAKRNSNIDILLYPACM